MAYDINIHDGEPPKVRHSDKPRDYLWYATVLAHDQRHASAAGRPGQRPSRRIVERLAAGESLARILARG